MNTLRQQYYSEEMTYFGLSLLKKTPCKIPAGNSVKKKPQDKILIQN